MQITEDLLYYIWRFRLFDFKNLKTQQGELIEIIEPGIRNTDAGPDFIMAKIKINDQLWVGNAELHVKSSDWNLHRHVQDPSYNNVILHIVWKHDEDIKNSLGQLIPCMELNKLVNNQLLSKYEYLMQNQLWVPCGNIINSVPSIIKQTWLSRLTAERLEQKSKMVLDALDQNNRDWESVCYQILARALGGQVNGEIMEILARLTPLSIIYKHRDQLLQLEALLFGQSGLLMEADASDEYITKLQNEYAFLKSKYNLQSLKSSQWKFLRMRPANFPTLRIAQLARILFQTDLLFSKFLSARHVNEIIHMLDVTISQYWKNHYTFNSKSENKEKHLGKETIHSIIINTISPLMFAYGISTANDVYKEKAIEWLEALPAEKNVITKGWTAIEWKATTAMDSQAQIQLKNKYCNDKKCLHCNIGHHLIKSTL